MTSTHMSNINSNSNDDTDDYELPAPKQRRRHFSPTVRNNSNNNNQGEQQRLTRQQQSLTFIGDLASTSTPTRATAQPITSTPKFASHDPFKYHPTHTIRNKHAKCAAAATPQVTTKPATKALKSTKRQQQQQQQRAKRSTPAAIQVKLCTRATTNARNTTCVSELNIELLKYTVSNERHLIANANKLRVKVHKSSSNKASGCHETASSVRPMRHDSSYISSSMSSASSASASSSPSSSFSSIRSCRLCCSGNSNISRIVIKSSSANKRTSTRIVCTAGSVAKHQAHKHRVPASTTATTTSNNKHRRQTTTQRAHMAAMCANGDVEISLQDLLYNPARPMTSTMRRGACATERRRGTAHSDAHNYNNNNAAVSILSMAAHKSSTIIVPPPPPSAHAMATFVATRSSAASLATVRTMPSTPSATAIDKIYYL